MMPLPGAEICDIGHSAWSGAADHPPLGRGGRWCVDAKTAARPQGGGATPNVRRAPVQTPRTF